MLKRLSELLFGEVEEEIVVEEFNEPKKNVNTKKTHPIKNKDLETETKKDLVPSDKNKKEIEDKKDKSIFINTSEPKPKKKYHKKETFTEEKPLEYEFTPVISPMKGIKDQNGQTVKIPKKRKSKPTQASSRLGTVLSPYHGLGKGKNPSDLPEAEPLDQEVADYDQALREQEEQEQKSKEIEALSLEEILVQDGPNLFTTAELHLSEIEEEDEKDETEEK